MQLIYLPKSRYRLARENVAPNRSLFDKYSISLKQKRKRYWHLFNSFLVFAFLIVSVRVGASALLLIRYEQGKAEFDLPRAESSEKIVSRDSRLNIYVDQRIVTVNNESFWNLEQLAYCIYDLYLHDPDKIPVIIADRKTDMEKLNYLTQVLDIAGFQEYYLKTYSPGLLGD